MREREHAEPGDRDFGFGRVVGLGPEDQTLSMPPETRYARSGNLHIAYQTVGDGPLDLVLVDQWFGNVEAQWEFPPLARLLTELASFSRLILLDKRGTGLSDPVSIESLPTIEEWIDDLRAVLDAVGSPRTALLSGTGAAFMTLVFAATYPERTSALVLVDPSARLAWAADNAWGLPVDRLSDDLERLRASWGVGGGTMNFLAPNLLQNRTLAEQYRRYERQSTGPGAAKAMIALLYELDVRGVLPAITVPTLVLQHAQATRIGPAHGRYVAERIKGARYVEVPGSENYIWAGDSAVLVAEIQEFLTGARPVPGADRVLATVLFTDIVESTKRAAQLGDTRWRELLAEHDRDVRQALERFRGREVKTTGDGFLATFDGPARAVRCAMSIRDAMAARGMDVRSGLHTGEIELAGADVAGIAVHIAARVCAMAGPGEVLASSTVKDLVAGSGIAFEPRGMHRLKGVPD
ncbi:MAG: adenylate/guanylate cyclase domain-containing protein, partial [Chloroflexota bacterium]|nr:adenylate/guanylate cyclase domain-containing protein [Chloroflexota bacterium]